MVVTPPDWLTSPPVLSVPTGLTVRLAGARLKASHGPGGAAATAGGASATKAPSAAIRPSFTCLLLLRVRRGQRERQRARVGPRTQRVAHADVLAEGDGHRV